MQKYVGKGAESAKKFIKMHLLRFVPDEVYSKWFYRKSVGAKLDLKNPQTFYHKINWLKLHYRDPLLKECSDKYTVRNYIKRKVGEGFLVPLLGVYDDAKEIDFHMLPDRFVLKETGGSNTNIICKNKNKLDIKKTICVLNKWRREDFFLIGREWCYKNNESRIICEKLLGDGNAVPKDYKIYCFHGEPSYIAVFHGRFTPAPSQTIYNTAWEAQECVMDYHFARNISDIEPPPACLDQMLWVAKVLSEDFIHVRVDFYIVDGQLYVGEMTFFNASGCTKMIPASQDYKIGKLIDLSLIDARGQYVKKNRS